MASSPSAKSRLLLIDTCVILEAHRLDVWQALVGQHNIVVPEGVVGEAIRVAREFDDVDLRLEQEVKEGRIQAPVLAASDLLIVRKCCPPFPGVIDAGEMECLAYLLKDASGTSQVCSSDAVVFRYLAWIQKEDRGISLEEALLAVNLGPPLSFKLTRAFREKWTKKGFAEAYQRGYIKL